MRTLIAALTCLMLFATPVVAGEVEDATKEATVIREALIAFDERNFPKAFRLNKPLAEQGNVFAS